MIPDSELLQEYLSHNSETAFKELVDRHIGLVYAAALRRTGQHQIAEDVVQAVFLIFAKKAPHMKRGTIIAGWLYRAAHLAAAHALRDELRRSAREKLAADLASINQQVDEEARWKLITPLLDDGLEELPSKDRDAVLLRFFQKRSLAEVGHALGCTEEAARKRVDRALERLRTFFKSRGVLASVATLTAALSIEAQTVPPSGLAHSTLIMAFGKGTVASATILHLVKITMKTMLWSKAPVAATLLIPLVAILIVPIALRGQPGTVDPDFTSRLAVTNSGEITVLALQSTGKILVGGSFACYVHLNGQDVPYTGLARLNSDGTVDNSFPSFDDRGIIAIAVQPDDKMVLGGIWSSTNATKHANLCRLTVDGRFDPEFNPGPGTEWQPAPTGPGTIPVSSAVRALAIQPDGKILVGGDFREMAGESHPALARLNSNGSIDPTFQPPTRDGDEVRRILLQPDGKIVISAAFKDPVPPEVLASVLRLNPDGSVDLTFHQLSDVRGGVLAIEKNGQILARLSPTNALDLAEPVRLVRLTSNGMIDPAFAATVSLVGVPKPYPQVFALLSAPGGKTIVLGKFNRINDAVQNDLARLNPDGSIDKSFSSSSGLEPLAGLSVRIGPALLQPDGKILFGGIFGKVNRVSCQSLTRLFGDPPLRFLNSHLTTEGLFQSTLSGGPAGAVFLETSSDLKNWTRLSVPVPGLDVLSVKVAGSSAFYKAIAE